MGIWTKNSAVLKPCKELHCSSRCQWDLKYDARSEDEGLSDAQKFILYFMTVESYHSSNRFIFHMAENDGSCWKVICQEYGLACMWLANVVSWLLMLCCIEANVHHQASVHKMSNTWFLALIVTGSDTLFGWMNDCIMVYNHICHHTILLLS